MSNTQEPAKILIVDDIPGNIRTVAETLRHDYKILMATNGTDALEAAEAEKVDLVLLDIIMPGMDGYEVCRRLKENPVTKDTPVIFITAQDEETDETQGLELGATDYITKPISPPILKARVKNHLDSKRQKDELASLSTTDALTGVANRRQFDAFLNQEWGRCVRGSLGLAVILLDIDCFKQYNDHFGHTTGDTCLRRVAQTLRQSLMRTTDLIARYGGEEFAAVLPQVERHGAEHVAEKMRSNIEALAIHHPESLVTNHVTISLGCASIFPTRGTSSSPLLEASDRMLYDAKRAGRNRVRSIVL
ncbi:MAG: diguanylate cyclase [Magnetococcales bacterium]|nr:diguanylate cyclase [Magnetococcales bacterium]